MFKAGIPCHIYQPETAKEREYSKADIRLLNEVLEPEMRRDWEAKEIKKGEKERKKGGVEIGCKTW